MKTSDVLIRQARLEDLLPIQRLARDTIENNYTGFLGDDAVHWYLESGQADSEIEESLDLTRVAVVGGHIQGFCVCKENIIHTIIVHPAMQKNGIGALLMKDAEALIQEKGFLRANVESFEGNTNAIKFYERLGWSLINKEVSDELGYIRFCFEKSLS